jgi:putative ABC transport system permease protein
MAGLAMRGIRAHRSRLVATVLSVLLGVSFMCGTAILADTVQASFNEVYVDVYGRIDVVVRSDRSLGGGFVTRRTKLPGELVERVAALDEVDAVEGQVEGTLRVLASDGRPLYNPQGGSPTRALNWLDSPLLNGWDLVEGTPPGPDEVVIDRRTARDGGYRVGDPVRLVTAVGPLERRLAGIATFSGLDTYSGSPAILFPVADAQELIGEPGRFDWISVVAAPGIEPDELTERVRLALAGPLASPSDPEAGAPEAVSVEVLTGEQLATERQDLFAELITFFTRLLSAFGLIALFVGAFIIFNTFTIIVGQRTRELALLRAVGASRRQVLGSVLVEAVIVGVLASLLGVVAGVGVARLLRVIIGAFGFELPDTPLVLLPSRAVLPVTAGVAVTTVAALLPALRAANTRPVSAMRDAALDRARHPVRRLVAALPFVALALLTGWWATRIEDEVAAGVALLAAVPALGALAVAGPVVTPPVAMAVARPLRRLTGITGRLAGRNAVRNPTRTSSTACAMVIGVALVCAIGVLAASLSAAVERTVDRTIAGDLVVVGNGFTGVSPAVAAEIDQLPEVTAAVGVRAGPVGLGPVVSPAGSGEPGDGEPGTNPPRQEFAVAAEPARLASIVGLEVSAGSLDELGPGTVAVSGDQARRDGVGVGDRLPVTFLIGGGRQLVVEVVAIYERSLTRNGEYLFALSGWDPNVVDSARVDQRVLIDLAPGVTVDQARPVLERALEGIPTVELLDVAEYRERQVGQITLRISYLYALLALSVIIGILGIVNTLVLSVHERAREIGLLRAVGAQRRQVGVAVLQEAVLVAVPGAVFGVAFGLVIGWLVVGTVELDGELPFTVPVTGTVLVALGACVAGLVAGVYPATRAGRVALTDPSALG